MRLRKKDPALLVGAHGAGRCVKGPDCQTLLLGIQLGGFLKLLLPFPQLLLPHDHQKTLLGMGRHKKLVALAGYPPRRNRNALLRVQ